jgi:YVTN family beta-propeller protein
MFVRFSHVIFAVLLCVGLVACASDIDIFPAVVTSTSESAVVLPNPVSIAADEARSQILVANSNVDIFFDTGSLAVLTVDAANPAAPVLSAAQIVSAPNFAGEIAFDGTGGTATIPFRESLDASDAEDQIRRYALGAGTVTQTVAVSAPQNPFGIARDAAGNVYVVCDDELEIYDSSLGDLAGIDLTTAGDAGLDDSLSSAVQDVAIDEANGRAFVSNPGGSLFVVDLASRLLTTVIDGPSATRDLVLDGASGLLYALDPVAAQVWIFDVNQLAVPSTTPGSQDDSTFLIATVPVGTDPNGMVLDAANDRLYIGNSLDNDIAVIDTLTFRQIARISISTEDLEATFGRGGDYPFALALGTFGGTQYLFISGFNANSVVMINTDTLTVVEVYPNNSL